MEPQPRKTPNNLTALYGFLDKHGTPPGILWTNEVIATAQKLCEQARDSNELQDLLEERSRGQDSLDLNERITSLEQSVRIWKLGKTYQASDLYGNQQLLTIPSFTLNCRLVVAFKGIVELSKLFNKSDEINPDLSKTTLFTLEYLEMTQHNITRSCYHLEPPYRFWKNSWETGKWHDKDRVWGCFVDQSKAVLGWWPVSTRRIETITEKKEWASVWLTLSERLKGLVRKHADRLKDVDKVVCFALGALTGVSPRCFVQHLAARTVADTLEELSIASGTPKTIKVVAQDPAYCRHCVAVLKTELDIDAVTDLSGFQILDKNSFVLTFAPTGPIPAMIADLTLASGGPAAMLCHRMDENYLRPEHEKGPWIDAVETKNLVAWKKTCLEEDFGDAQDFLGTTYETFEKDFPEIISNLAHGTDAEIAYKVRALQAHRKASQCIFKDAWLYVKKAC